MERFNLLITKSHLDCDIFFRRDLTHAIWWDLTPRIFNARTQEGKRGEGRVEPSAPIIMSIAIAPRCNWLEFLRFALHAKLRDAHN